MAELPLADRSAHELTELLAGREVSAMDVLDSCLARVDQVEDRVRSFLTMHEHGSRSEAMHGGRGPSGVAGVPLALKDVLCTMGLRTTCGSRILEDYVPPYDCTAWARLDALGSVLVGKTNCDEFAMGSSTENSAFFPTRNPWDLERVPGGSSGGSAAAVAAGEAIWALGTDTGGSVRQPASLCGIVGLKPTYGLVSRYGLIAFASSLDHVSPVTRDVRDAATLLSAIGGHDPKDSTSIDRPPQDYTRGLEGGVGGLRIGVLEDWISQEGVEPGVAEAVRQAAKRFEALGARVDTVELPHAEYALSAYYLIAPAECSSNLARYDGVRYGHRAEGARDVVEMNMRSRGEGFGDEVKRRIMLGTYSLSAGYYDAYYGQAQKVRTLIVRDFNEAFARFDLLLSPTSPTVAFRLGEKSENPLAMYLCDVFTIPADLAGVPAISVPCGLSDGLPVGLQLHGRVLDERTVLRAAYAFEQDLGFAERPPLLTEATP